MGVLFWSLALLSYINHTQVLPWAASDWLAFLLVGGGRIRIFFAIVDWVEYRGETLGTLSEL